MRVVIFIILVLMIRSVSASDNANTLVHPTGIWSFDTPYIGVDIKIIVDFRKLRACMEQCNEKSKNIPVHIAKNSFTADFGFGKAAWVIKQVNEKYFLCGKEKQNDCVSIRQEK